jgi:hypothetical protein
VKADHVFSSDVSRRSSLVVGAAGLAHFTQNTTNVDWRAKFKLTEFRFCFKRDDQVYDGNADTNFLCHNYKGVVAVTFPSLPKTRFFLEGQYLNGIAPKSSSNINDYKGYRAYIGAYGKIAKKIIAVVKGGYEIRDYKGDDSSERSRDASGYSYEASIHYNFSKKLSFALSAMREDRATTYSGDIDEGTDWSLSCNYLMHRNIEFTPSIQYSNDKYGGGKQANTYGASAGLKYSYWKWLTVGLSYRYTFCDSQLESGSYKDNICMISMEAKF